MSLPPPGPADALRRAMDATWPAAERVVTGGLVTGSGLGAGGRVSSSRLLSPDWTADDLTAAEDQHRAWEQPALFRVFDDQTALAEALGRRGYAAFNPTAIMAVPVASLVDPAPDPMTAFMIWPPLAVQRDIWAAGGIGPARQAVMARVEAPRTALLGRACDRPAGAGFVAISDGIAMLHALEVLAPLRRGGLGAALVRKAAGWAAEAGASTLALAVSCGNAGGMALYARLGFAEVERYSYFGRPDERP